MIVQNTSQALVKASLWHNFKAYSYHQQLHGVFQCVDRLAQRQAYVEFDGMLKEDYD